MDKNKRPFGLYWWEELNFGQELVFLEASIIKCFRWLFRFEGVHNTNGGLGLKKIPKHWPAALSYKSWGVHVKFN